MELHRYFQWETSLPQPKDPLSGSINPASIRDANDAVPLRYLEVVFVKWA